MDFVRKSTAMQCFDFGEIIDSLLLKRIFYKDRQFWKGYNE